jgi:TRAP-type C4-dicarboxylate transport system substrate-binding protein
MKIKFIMTSLALVLVLAIFLGACSNGTTTAPTSAAAPKVIELKCSTFFGAPAAQSKALDQFCKDVEEQSGGKIKITFYPGGTLLSAAATYQGIVDGVADIGYCHTGYTAGRFAVTEVITSTMGWPSAWVGAHVANEFYNKFKPKEWDDTKVLWLNANEPKVIYSKKAIRTLEDLKGLTIRAPGSPGDIITALGATPAPTPTSELADAISKGTVDGAFLPYETLKTFKTADVSKYITACWNIGSTDCFYMVMNKNAYKKLDALPEAKAVFDRLVGQYFEYFGGLVWNQIDYDGLAYAKTKGMEVIELSDAEAARWQAAAAPAVDKYKTAMVGKGYSAAEVQSWIDFNKQRIDFWTAKQIELKIPSLTGPAGMRP